MNLAPAAPAADPPSQAAALSDACTALWLATLSLMTAFMQTAAPAHRYLMARRIARNFETLKDQACFTPQSRASFARLAQRWQLKVDRLAPQEHKPAGGLRVLQKLLAR